MIPLQKNDAMRRLTFFLVSTDHLSERLWFRDDEDFKVGMNYVAILAVAYNVRILAFILMSNHVHFVLEGTLEEVSAFIKEFKRRYSKYYQQKYGVREFLRKNGVDITPVWLDGESMERAIAYVQMNCVAANICAHPSQYRWGTGSVFFSADKPVGTPLGSLSRRAQIRALKSNDLLPQSFCLTETGFVDPASYVDCSFVEQLFRTPNRYNFKLQNSSKAKIRLQESTMPTFRDQSILAATPDLIRSLFRKNSLQELSREEKGELLKQLRFRFSADVAQLSRILEIPYKDAVSLLDSI